MQFNHTYAELAGNYSGPGGMTIGLTVDAENQMTISGANTYHGGTQIGSLVATDAWWANYVLNSSSGWAIPGDLTMNGNWTWVDLYQGEENGGQAQMNPAGVITFAVGGNNQFLAINGRPARVAGIVDRTTTDDTSFISDYYASPLATLILQTPSGATYSYREHC